MESEISSKAVSSTVDTCVNWMLCDFVDIWRVEVLRAYHHGRGAGLAAGFVSFNSVIGR